MEETLGMVSVLQIPSLISLSLGGLVSQDNTELFGSVSQSKYLVTSDMILTAFLISQAKMEGHSVLYLSMV